MVSQKNRGARKRHIRAAGRVPRCSQVGSQVIYPVQTGSEDRVQDLADGGNQQQPRAGKEQDNRKPPHNVFSPGKYPQISNNHPSSVSAGAGKLPEMAKMPHSETGLSISPRPRSPEACRAPLAKWDHDLSLPLMDIIP